MRKFAALISLLWCINLAMFVGVSGCCQGGACGKKGAVVATIATVKTLDEGIKAFAKWAAAEEDKIANQAIAVCGNKTEPFGECVHAEAAKHREPIDKAKAALKLYDAALAAAQGARTSDVAATAAALTEALSVCGIVIGGGL
jgi:precorrin-6B methylase 2